MNDPFYAFFNPMQGPAPLPLFTEGRTRICNDVTGCIYAAWREMYFATHYPQEN